MDVTVTVDGANVPCEQALELDVGFVEELDEGLLGLEDETDVNDRQALELELELLVLVGLGTLEDLVDEDKTELELLGPLDVLDFEDESEVGELVSSLDVVDLNVEIADEELRTLLDELEEAGLEEVLVLVVLPPDVVEILEDVELVGLALDVLDVIVGVAVHSPVTEGIALTPEPIGTISVPQLAA